MRRITPIAAALVLAVLASTLPAAADTIITGTIGRVFGGDTDRGHLSYGADIAFLGEGVVGLEVEGTYTPDFFIDAPSAASNNLTTLMGNVLLATPAGRTSSGLRLYATGGVGLMKFRATDIDLFLDQSDFGMNAGAGAMLQLGGSFGVRADVRYFRDLQTRTGDPLKADFGKFHYWRGAIGATLRF